MTPDTKARLRQFLSRSFTSHELKDEDDFFAMQLVLFVEQEFQFTIENEDLDLDNFRSINALANLIKCKTTHAIS